LRSSHESRFDPLVLPRGQVVIGEVGVRQPEFLDELFLQILHRAERRKSKAGEESCINDGGSGEIDVDSGSLHIKRSAVHGGWNSSILHYLSSAIYKHSLNFSSTYRKMRLFVFCKFVDGRIRCSFLIFSCIVPREQNTSRVGIAQNVVRTTT